MAALGPQLAPLAYQRMWTALHHSPIQQAGVVNGISLPQRLELMLPDNTRAGLWRQGGGIDRMMIRDAHDDLWTIISNFFANRPEPPHNKRNILILGTPGTSKTTGLAFFMKKIITANVNAVIVVEFRGGKRIRYGPGPQAQVMEGSRQQNDFRDELSDRNTWYLVDSYVPDIEAEAQTIEVSSPNPAYWKDFEKYALIYFMPPFNFQEAWLVRNLFQLPVTRDELKKRICIVGGSMRKLLQTVATLQQDIKSAMGRTSGKLLMESPGEAMKQQGVPDVLLHIIVETEAGHPSRYIETHTQFCSNYVASKVREKFDKEMRHYFSELIRSSTIRGAGRYFGVLAGRVFEDFAVRAIAEGGTWATHKMVNRKPQGRSRLFSLTQQSFVEDVVVEDEDFVAIDAAAHQAARAGIPTIGYPTDPNFPAIDCFMLQGDSVLFFQMKHVRSDAHRVILIQHLTRFRDYFVNTHGRGAAVTVKLYQVVPEFRYDETEGLEFRDAAGNTVARPAGFEEWKLSMPTNDLEDSVKKQRSSS